MRRQTLATTVAPAMPARKTALKLTRKPHECYFVEVSNQSQIIVNYNEQPPEPSPIIDVQSLRRSLTTIH